MSACHISLFSDVLMGPTNQQTWRPSHRMERTKGSCERKKDFKLLITGPSLISLILLEIFFSLLSLLRYVMRISNDIITNKDLYTWSKKRRKRLYNLLENLFISPIRLIYTAHHLTLRSECQSLPSDCAEWRRRDCSLVDDLIHIGWLIQIDTRSFFAFVGADSSASPADWEV